MHIYILPAAAAVDKNRNNEFSTVTFLTNRNEN